MKRVQNLLLLSVSGVYPSKALDDMRMTGTISLSHNVLVTFIGAQNQA